jgi:hypothetical protein
MLTREEKKYIAQHPDLTIAVVANDYPYYKNSNDHNPRALFPIFTPHQPTYKSTACL